MTSRLTSNSRMPRFFPVTLLPACSLPPQSAIPAERAVLGMHPEGGHSLAIPGLRRYTVTASRSSAASDFKARLEFTDLFIATRSRASIAQQHASVPVRKVSVAASEGQQVR